MKNNDRECSSKNYKAKDAVPAQGLCIDRQFLIKRVNALMVHAGGIAGEETAEKNAREISMHLKNLKDIEARDKTIKAEQDEKNYTRYEDLPPPHPDDIAAYRRKLDGIIARFVKSDTAEGNK